MTKILLVQPEFPLPKKAKIDHASVPIGLLKIGSYLKHCKGASVRLVRGNRPIRYDPDEIWMTSLFTYWSKYVKESVDYYRSRFPKARITVGGIYASLMPDHCKRTTRANVHMGLHVPSEEWCARNTLDYSLLDDDVDFQILHGMRGCFRRCKFCGTWKLEPRMTFDRNVASRVSTNRVVFYDNNFLKNRYIRDILKELSQVRVNRRKVQYECQSGFDGRILDEDLAHMLKEAGFVNPRIAWDNSFDDGQEIKRQIGYLEKAGYKSKDIYVFMLYDWEYDFQILERKRLKCWEWQVQISDCRFRPLDQLHDHFNSRKSQTSLDYYIHPNWTDEEVKQFRKNVRRHNICVRHSFPFYSATFERMRISKREALVLRKQPKDVIRLKVSDVWFPDESNPPTGAQMHVDRFTSRAPNVCQESDLD